jgi:D-3-phosphoglycerate dehydrogenase
MLRQADYVSINCPHTAETRMMMGAAQFAMMQPHAYFITTARGGIHNEDALAQALTAKQIAAPCNVPTRIDYLYRTKAGEFAPFIP